MTEVFPIRSRRFERAARVQTAQHLLAAVLLATTAIDHLKSNAHHGVLPYLELFTALALVGAVIWQKLRKSHGHGRFGWLELAGGAMTTVEAIAKLQQRHHLLFHVLTFVSPLLLFYFGLFDARIRAGMRMEANDDAFILQRRVFTRTRVPWDGIVRYQVTAKRIALIRDDGTIRNLDVADLLNRDEAVEWAEAQFAKRGIVQGNDQRPPAAGAEGPRPQ